MRMMFLSDFMRFIETGLESMTKNMRQLALVTLAKALSFNMVIPSSNLCSKGQVNDDRIAIAPR